MRILKTLVLGVLFIGECQIYPSADANAPMVATEIIVPTTAWAKMDATEQAYLQTHGKVYVLWDPMDGKGPAGKPIINNLEGNQP